MTFQGQCEDPASGLKALTFRCSADITSSNFTLYPWRKVPGVSDWSMARFRRKYCIVLIALVLLVLTVAVILKALSLEGMEGVDLFPVRKNAVEQKAEFTKIPEPIKMIRPTISYKHAEVEALLKKFPPPNYYVHTFYYAWYGNPKFDGKYIHWDHPQLPHWDKKIAQGYPQGRHSPPDDIGSNFYPSLGPYSSKDPAVVEAHMQQLRTAAIGERPTQTTKQCLQCLYKCNIKLPGQIPPVPLFHSQVSLLYPGILQIWGMIMENQWMT